MFFNFSHNSAGKEEEEDPHMEIFTPYSKYSFASLTRNYIYTFISLYYLYIILYIIYYILSVSEINLMVFRIYIVIHKEITFALKQKKKKKKKKIQQTYVLY